MKKTIITIISTTIILMLLSPFQTLAVTRDEALDYAKSKIDTVVGNGQCVAFVKDYYKAVFGETVYGNGSDYINNTPDGFTQYLYGTNDWDPQPGDIVSWSWNKYGGNYGHVGIITRTDSKGFYYLNQNPYPVQENYFAYGKSGWTLAGVVRPPFEDDKVTEMDLSAEESTKKSSTELSNGISQIVDQMIINIQSATAAAKNLKSK